MPIAPARRMGASTIDTRIRIPAQYATSTDTSPRILPLRYAAIGEMRMRIVGRLMKRAESSGPGRVIQLLCQRH